MTPAEFMTLKEALIAKFTSEYVGERIGPSAEATAEIQVAVENMQLWLTDR